MVSISTFFFSSLHFYRTSDVLVLFIYFLPVSQMVFPSNYPHTVYVLNSHGIVGQPFDTSLWLPLHHPFNGNAVFFLCMSICLHHCSSLLFYCFCCPPLLRFHLLLLFRNLRRSPSFNFFVPIIFLLNLSFLQHKLTIA